MNCTKVHISLQTLHVQEIQKDGKQKVTQAPTNIIYVFYYIFGDFFGINLNIKCFLQICCFGSSPFQFYKGDHKKVLL